MIKIQNVPIGLYVHLPWCIAKCPYCDFNSHVAQDTPFERYVDVLLSDLVVEIEHTASRPISSIFFGGGTPSLFPAAAIARFLDGLMSLSACAPDLEITLEANPGAAEAERFAAYRETGVNRLSIGVQSFDDKALRSIGRVHDAEDARAAVRSALEAGFDNINIDLMYGLPGSTSVSTLADLREAIAFSPAHISWYELTLEAGTTFARKPPLLPDADALDEWVDEGRVMLSETGFARYEVSAYARSGRRSRHNCNYWELADYIGIGAGAHGKFSTPGGVYRTEKRRSPTAYMNDCSGKISGPLSDAELVTEFAINSLRLADGIDFELFEHRTGLSSSLLRPALASAHRNGWLTSDEQHLRPTELGLRFLNDLQLLFMA